jgi:hypothetical protein
VEAVPSGDAGACPASGDSVRQVPHHAASRGGVGRGAKERICALAGRDRRYIKGQKYTLLSRRENLTLDGKNALKTLLAANKRLNTAYVLKESFGQLWSYEREGWARRFFENWRASLKWQRLAPYEKFAEMIDRHRSIGPSAIAPRCRPQREAPQGRRRPNTIAAFAKASRNAFSAYCSQTANTQWTRYIPTRNAVEHGRAVPGKTQENCQEEKSAAGTKQHEAEIRDDLRAEWAPSRSLKISAVGDPGQERRQWSRAVESVATT